MKSFNMFNFLNISLPRLVVAREEHFIYMGHLKCVGKIHNDLNKNYVGHLFDTFGFSNMN